MNTHLSLSESGQHRFFKVQHRWIRDGKPDPHWSGGSAMNWGRASIEVAWRHSEYPSGEFATREEAEAFLREWVPTVVSHQSVDFRVVEITAQIVVTSTLELEGPRVCGAWSDFAYCQKAPKHRGAHDSRAWKLKDQNPAAARADGEG